MNIEARKTVHKKPHPPPAISPHKSSGRLKSKEARTKESNYRPHWRNPERVLQSQASREVTFQIHQVRRTDKEVFIEI